MKNIFIRSFSMICLIVVVLFFSYSVVAAEAPRLFDKLISYNIYFTGTDGQIAVFESVEIVGFEEITGKTFLVFKASGFNLKPVNGYIFFDKIIAIVPTSHPRLKNVESLSIPF